MNQKGFTLVELLATIIILALMIGIGTYSITSIIRNSKQKNYENLIDSIKSGAETYYQECKYANNSGITCSYDNGKYTTTLGDMVTYGYLKGNDTIKTEQNNNINGRYTIVNPNDNKSISNCAIEIAFTGGKIIVTDITNSGSCPKTSDYQRNS